MLKLKDHFGDPQQIICAHNKELITVVNCMGEQSSYLRVAFDKIMVHIPGQETLQIMSEQ